MAEQQQFLDVIDRDEAERRFHAAVRLAPLGGETVAASSLLGRVLATDVQSNVDVPSFDRSNFDGFAVRAADTYGADEEVPRRLRLLKQVIATAVVPDEEVQSGTAATIATGGMLPRGADSIVMVEHADVDGDAILVRKPVTPGLGVAYAGTDVCLGEIVLRRGTTLTSRETGVLAAIGLTSVTVWRQPRVAVISTGDEIIPPGQPMRPGLVYDSNSRILADAVSELGGIPVMMGTVSDDVQRLRTMLRSSLAQCDAVLLSGGTSKGAGDLSYRVVQELTDPGVVAHGVALKPGKPICLAASGGKPVVVLPGFPTSAIFTFHEFVAPVLRRLAGRRDEPLGRVQARLATRINSEVGRTEYALVGLVPQVTAVSPAERHATSASLASGPQDQDAAPIHASKSSRQVGPRQVDAGALAAYPMGRGSGSVTTFSHADGFITIGRHEEILDADAVVEVQLLGRHLRAADLVVIGSHCLGMDFLLGCLQDEGWQTKFLAVGSTAGLAAARRGECDLAGVHLLDPETNRYNEPFLTADLTLIPGYERMQGIVARRDDERFAGLAADAAIDVIRRNETCVMVNRNLGSGTRILIDRLLTGKQPGGYGVQPRSHNAVAAAVAQGRADWGVAIRSAADAQQLAFLPLTWERYDFVAPKARVERPAVVRFAELLQSKTVREELRNRSFRLDDGDAANHD